MARFEREPSEFVEKLVSLNRVSKTVSRYWSRCGTRSDGGVRACRRFWRALSYGASSGRNVAERARAKGIETVVFDRGGYVYHGRVRPPSRHAPDRRR